MRAQQVSVKVLADAGDVAQSELIPIFHRWIRDYRKADRPLLRAAFDGRLLIDVADYSHVPEGPGVMIIGHEAHWGLDEAPPGVGLKVSRKRDTPGPVSDKLVEALGDALAAAHALEREPSLAGRLRFRTDRLLVWVTSRLVAPNTAETFEAFAPALGAVLERLHPGAADLTHLDDPRAPFGVSVTLPEAADLPSLLGRLRPA